jgi:hypothetical protein
MLRKMFIPLLVPIALLSACKSSSSTVATPTTPAKVSASVWAGGFCTDLSAWKASMQTAAARIKAAPSSSDPVGEFKNGVNDALTATSSLLDQLQALGTPNTQSGQQITAALKSMKTSIQTELNTIKDEASKLSSSTSLTQATSSIATIATQLDTLSTDMQAGISSLKSADVTGELATAISNEPSCQTFAGISPSAGASSSPN